MTDVMSREKRLASQSNGIPAEASSILTRTKLEALQG